jgi:hypothetical protein
MIRKLCGTEDDTATAILRLVLGVVFFGTNCGQRGRKAGRAGRSISVSSHLVNVPLPTLSPKTGLDRFHPVSGT